MHTPFGEKTRLEVPSLAEPGRPFETSLHLVNESTANLTTPVIRFTFPEGITPQSGMLYVDGTPQNKAAFEGTGVVRVKLPSVKPGVARVVTVTCTVDVPTEDGTSLPVGVEITATGHSREIQAIVVAQSSHRFALDQVSLEIDGDDEIAEGETRDGYLSIANDGTAIAHNVVVDLAPHGLVVTSSSHDLVDGRRITLGDVRPGEPIGIEFSVEATGAADPALRPSLSVDGTQSEELPSRAFTVVSGPLFDESSVLYRRGDVAVLPGTVATIGVRLENTGARTAHAPFVEFDLPDGVRPSAGDAMLQFRDIAPGRSAEASIMLTFDVAEDVAIRASVNGMHDLAPLTVRIGAQTSFVPVRIGLADPDQFESRDDVAHFDSVGLADARYSPRVRTPFGFLFEVLNEGNAPCDGEVGLHLAQHMRFVQGTLRVNGLSVNDDSFGNDGLMRFADIEPGAVISLTVRVDALRPTLRGATTAITGVVRWNGHEQSLACVPFSVLPAALYPGSREQLPFTIVDAPAIAGAAALAIGPAPAEVGPPIRAAAVPPAPTAVSERVAPAGPAEAPLVEPAVDAAIAGSSQPGNGPAVVAEPIGDTGGTSVTTAVLEDTGAATVAAASEAALASSTSDDSKPQHAQPQIVRQEPVYSFAAMEGKDRSRIGEFVTKVPASDRASLAFYLAFARMLLPASASIEGAEDLTYERARKTFATLTTVGVSKLGAHSAVGEKDVLRFADAGEVYALRYASDLAEFPSVASDAPSIAARVAAMLLFCGLQLEDQNEGHAIEAYIEALVQALAALDSASPEAFGAAMIEGVGVDLSHHVAALLDLFAEPVAV